MSWSDGASVIWTSAAHIADALRDRADAEASGPFQPQCEELLFDYSINGD